MRDESLIQGTFYFQFFVFEVLAKAGRGELILGELDRWRDMLAMGLTTFPEHGPESRTGAHAWASHPLYHLLAFLAGVRPAEPVFRSVRIEPAPGGLGRFAAKVCHPRVLIQVEWKVTDTAEGSGGTFVVSLPSNLSGVFAWDGEEWPLRPGVSRTQVDAKAMQSFSRDRTTADGSGVPGGGGAASNGSYNRELGR